MSKRKPHSETRKRKFKLLFEAQAGLCCHCDQPMEVRVIEDPTSFSENGHTPSDAATFEHVFPMTSGFNLLDLLLAHSSCNHARGHTPPTEKLLNMRTQVHQWLYDNDYQFLFNSSRTHATLADIIKQKLA